MDLQVIIGLLLTLLPIFELRGGLPILIEYSLRNGVSIWPYFIIVLILNILVILLIFLFFDFLHERFMKLKIYRKLIGKLLVHFQKKVDKTKKGMESIGYLALVLFVAIPLPGTGAWTGTLVAWILGADRLKSFLAIALGVVIAGFLVLFASLGFFSGFY